MLDEMTTRPLNSRGIWNLSFVLPPVSGEERVWPVNGALQDAILIEFADEKRSGLLVQAKGSNTEQELVAGILHSELKKGMNSMKTGD